MDYDHMLTKDEIIEQRDELYAAGLLTNSDGSLTRDALRLQELYEKNDELKKKAEELKAMFKNLSEPEAERLFEFLFEDHRTYQQLLFGKICWAGVKVYAATSEPRDYDLRNEASKKAAKVAWDSHPFYFPYI
jgi:hypothetical protein